MLGSCPYAVLNRCTRLDRGQQAHSGTCQAEPRNSYALSYPSTKFRLYNRSRIEGQELRAETEFRHRGLSYSGDTLGPSVKKRRISTNPLGYLALRGCGYPPGTEFINQ
jgi:hypothetical protein